MPYCEIFLLQVTAEPRRWLQWEEVAGGGVGGEKGVPTLGWVSSSGTLTCDALSPTQTQSVSFFPTRWGRGPCGLPDEFGLSPAWVRVFFCLVHECGLLAL